ncbi:phosphatase PAP2 family protein [Chryseobacterium sp. POL2]|nr:phosphatase PAP2 family protein [Chryseobacterium sp. POL2]
MNIPSKSLIAASFLSCINLFCQEKDSIVLYNIIAELPKTQSYKISETETFTYQKPRIWDLVNKIPTNVVGTAKDVVSKEVYPYSLGALGLTLAMLPADPWVIKNSRSFGNDLGLSEDHYYKDLGPLKIIPGNANSAFYFLGNGMTVVLLSGGMLTYGLIDNDYRAMSTSLQLLESIAISGLFSQPIKRLTGRESPFVTINEGRQHSAWKFAPSFKTYQNDTSRYDAMPSGHLMTAMSALTVLTENYPEKKWIKPIGYSLLGLLAFEMMQSEVHWASDYPIAILLGYIIGKNIAKSRITKSSDKNIANKPKKYKLQLTAAQVYEYKTLGLSIKF